MRPSFDVRVARVYDAAEPGDGARILVDGLWPRGLSKQAAGLDVWCRQIAPSTELRTWYAHDPARLTSSQRGTVRTQEPERAVALDSLRERSSRQVVTLLTATKAIEIGHAVVLANVLCGDS